MTISQDKHSYYNSSIIDHLNIYIFTVLLYLLPMMGVALFGGNLVSAYSSGSHLHSPLISSFIFSISLFIGSAIVAVKFKISFKIFKIQNNYLFASIFIFYFSFVIFSVLFLINKLDLLHLWQDLLFDQVAYLIKSPMVGVRLSEEGLLKFYFIIHLLPVLWFFISYSADNVKLSFFRRIISISLFVFMVMFFYILTRRELFLYLMLVVAMTYGKRLNIAIYILVASLILFLAFFTVAIRTGNLDSGLIDYFYSEEYYPFQLSLYMIDRWVDSPNFFNLLRVTPFAFLFDLPTTVSPEVMRLNFNYVGPGPTIGLPYALVSLGFLYPCIYLFFNTIFLNSIRSAINISVHGYRLIPLYCYCLLKLFLLIRNGEYFNHLLDVVIFLTLYVPFIFIIRSPNAIK